MLRDPGREPGTHASPADHPAGEGDACLRAFVAPFFRSDPG
jgi:hypothetical protein